MPMPGFPYSTARGFKAKRENLHQMMTRFLILCLVSCAIAAGPAVCLDDDELRARVGECRSQGWDLNTAECSDMPFWDTSNVTDMSGLFYNDDNFNLDISAWNTSRVVDMHEMFYGAELFNGDLLQWDTSRVTNMAYMFYDAEVFNRDISKWDTSAVTDMECMFCYAYDFNQNLSAWDTGRVTTMLYMFYDAYDFNGDISAWDTGRVTNMGYLFYEAEVFNTDISKWNTSSVTDMECMFCYAYVFSGDLSAWDTGRVTTMLWMFYEAYYFHADVGRWDVKNVEDMEEMFYYCCWESTSPGLTFAPLDTDFSSWNTSKVTDMNNMFQYSYLITGRGVGEWDVSRVTDMSGMFYEMTIFNQDLSKWDNSKVTTMSFMFHEAQLFNGDVSGWNTAAVTAMRSMFSSTVRFNVDISSWDVSSVTNMEDMFENARRFNIDLCDWELNDNLYSPGAFSGNPKESFCDVNECLLGVSCGETSDCSNNDGSFSCLCREGFQQINDTCTDFDECNVEPGFPCGESCAEWKVTRIRVRQGGSPWLDQIAFQYENAPDRVLGGGGNPLEDFVLNEGEVIVRIRRRSGLCTDGFQIVTNLGSESIWYGGFGGNRLADFVASEEDPIVGLTANPHGLACLAPLSGFVTLSEAGGSNCLSCNHLLQQMGYTVANCNANATCSNTLGSFQCTCQDGFESEDGGATCHPGVDECATAAHNCHEHATCTNTLGSFTCTCNRDDGFSGDGIACSDTNECVHGPVIVPAGQFPVWFDGNRSEWSTVDVNAEDEAYFQRLPFSFQVDGRELSTEGFWVSSNSLFTFESKDDHWLPSVGNPDQLTLHVGGSDTFATWLGYREVTENGVVGRAYHFDGRYYHNDDGRYDIVPNRWEVVFFADNSIRMAHLEAITDSARLHYGFADGETATWLMGGSASEAPWNFPLGSAILFKFPDRIPSRNACGEGVCTNSIGSFACSAECGEGYVEAALRECVDADECETGVHDCAPGDTCTNTEGSFTCTPPSSVCADAGLWSACRQSSCCAGGMVCYEQNEWYAQCLLPNSCKTLYEHLHGTAHEWTCTALSTPQADPSTPVCEPGDKKPEWGDCSQSRCCVDGLVCYEQNAWYAQCLQPGTCCSLYGHMGGVHTWTCNELSVRSLTSDAALSGPQLDAASLNAENIEQSLSAPQLAGVAALVLVAAAVLLSAVVVAWRRRTAPVPRDTEAACKAGLNGQLAYAAPLPEPNVAGGNL